jgi:uncharacterized integral membrane protein
MIRAVALFIGLTLVGLFALLNWTAFVTPTPLSLGVTTVEAPLGLVMLGVVGFLSVLFVVWAMTLQAGALMESRRVARDLQAQRDLADKAEASRFTELRTFLAAELNTVAVAQEQTRAMMMSRLDRAQEAARASQEEASNTLSAYIGELEDRLERAQLVPAQYERSDDRPLRR